MCNLKLAAVSVSLVTALNCSRAAFGQLLGNMNLNEQIGASNDFPPSGSNTPATVSDTSIPFQKSISANNGTGATVTATYSISDNGSVAALSISASGNLTANGNSFAAGTTSAGTTFNLLEPAYCNAQITCHGTNLILGSDITAEAHIYDGNNLDLFDSATGGSPVESTSATLSPGEITFGDSWGIGYNDAIEGKPADESGTYSLTLTFTAIPEPSSAALIAIPAIFALSRRRQTRASA